MIAGSGPSPSVSDTDPAKQIAIVRTVIPAAAVRGWNRP